MAPKIQIHNPQKHLIDEERLIQAARTVLEKHPEDRSASLSIVIASAELSRELNRRHRQTDAPTDVLSFSAPALPEVIQPAERYLGDIVIADDIAAAHARNRAADLDAALSLLVIHGTLHLLGYDHDSVESQERMWAAQAEALTSLGIDPAVVSRYETVTDG